MNFEVEPIVAGIVNLLVGLLVSKGIIDSVRAPMFAQEINNGLAAIVTLGIVIVSIYKEYKLRKHQITVDAQSKTGISVPSVTTPTNSPAPMPYIVTNAQTGLPVITTKG